jgi:hypothetical protein
MRALAKNGQTDSIAPAVHLEFIQNRATFAEGDALEEVEAYHRALFLHHHAHDLERFQQEVRIHEDQLGRFELALQETNSRLSGINKLIPVQVNGEPDIHPTSPWNAWDRAMFIGALLGICALLVFGVLNISFNLLESGLITFTESPMRAYFWAALLPVGALGVKIGWDFLQRQRLRDFYLWSCLTAGVAGVLLWLAAYAFVYPTLSKSTSEHIDSLSVFDSGAASHGLLGGTNAAGVKTADAVIVGSQAVAEIFLSAVLGIYMTVIYGRHRPVRLSANPLYMQLDQERESLVKRIATERLALGEARGKMSRLENQMAALLSYAKSMFQKETAVQRDRNAQKIAALDRISAQLRVQLAGVRENGSGTTSSDADQITFGRETEK